MEEGDVKCGNTYRDFFIVTNASITAGIIIF